MNNRHLFTLAGILFAIGIGVFAWRAFVLGYPILPGEREAFWNLEASIELEGDSDDVQVDLLIPNAPPGFSLWDENFISRGFSLSTRADDADNRWAVWSTGDGAGVHTLYYRAVGGQLDSDREAEADEEPAAPESPDLDGARAAAADYLVDEIGEISADAHAFARELLSRLNAEEPDDNVEILLGGDTERIDRARMARDLLHHAGLPARLVRVTPLPEQEGALTPESWIEVWDADAGWEIHAPDTGDPGLPTAHLVWGYGDDPMVSVQGGSIGDLTLSANRVEVDALQASDIRGQVLAPGLERLSLQNLPVHAQNVYRLLLLVPVAAIVLVLMRNFVGVKTFGTFMPILIALAFRETGVLWGVILLIAIVFLGLAARFYLERLHLLAVPRITSVLVVVILLMVGLSLLSYELGLDQAITVALFPMVILAMTIERMSVVWEERGAGEALQQGAGSLAVAVVSYPVMFNPWVEHLVFVFPETLLAVLAVVLLLGRYTGYRLTEIHRFRALARERG